MGSITITNGLDVEEHSSAALDGRITIDLDDGGHVRFVVAADGAVDETAVDGSTVVSRPAPPTLDKWWLLVAPLAGALVLAPVQILAPELLRTGPSASGLVAFALLVPFFLLCVAGTILIYRDAVALRAAGADWTPNPWLYFVPSALAPTLARAYPLLERVESVDGVVGFAVGTFVVALVASSLLAGPVYLYNRDRHVGVP